MISSTSLWSVSRWNQVLGSAYNTRTSREEVALGMTLLGLIFSSMLYGITLTQTYKYFQRFQNDPLFVKLMVVAVCLLDTVSVFLVAHACWYYLVTTGPIGRAVWSLNAELALSMLISGIAETFLAYRVWMLSNRRTFLTCLLLFLALLHLASGEVSAIQFLTLKRFAKFGSVKIPSILRLGSAALCDTGIAISLCYFLHQKRTGFERTDKIIDYLILFAINSGLLTSIASVACLVTYLVVPRTWVYLALCFLISRLYANTFLCSLNSRQILRIADSENDSPIVPRFRPVRLRDAILGRSNVGNSEKSPTQIDIYVYRETVTDSRGGQSSLEASRNAAKASRNTSASEASSILESPR
ncbi:hypothetical protein LshimejAT787_0602670 [Lyophyllum shimeji]|uniref:DUF6534 domain-containing protein n=1 Tax=Lyophyllum shimeji TaxID=47721 RepID=A0A9P3PMJ8_LYOSH|nr:hypothetical protein LshimejAT787_0602670 [Lyophyllum shimeji]